MDRSRVSFDGSSCTTSSTDAVLLILINNIQSSLLHHMSIILIASFTGHFSKDTARGYHHIDSVNLTIDGHQLLFSLRKQARVAALFVLMAGASANGGAIGGNDAVNGQVAGADVGDARPQPQPQLQPQPYAQRHEEFAAAQRSLRCVSPEPMETASFPCESNASIEMRTKRRRLDP